MSKIHTRQTIHQFITLSCDYDINYKVYSRQLVLNANKITIENVLCLVKLLKETMSKSHILVLPQPSWVTKYT